MLAALVANLGIAVTKFVAWALTGASSMLAEAIHSVADSGNQLLLLVGGRAAKRAATPEHPFGFGRERYVYAFIVSIVLFTLGGLFALYEAYHKWHEYAGGHHDGFGRWWWVPIAVLLVAILLEARSFSVAIREANHVRGGQPWVAFIHKAKAPELPVILLEDFAALLGLVFALLGVGLTLATGNGLWDAAGTALIGLLLVVVALVLAVEMKSLLLGEGATPEHVRAIRAALVGDGTTDIDRVIHLRTLHLGPEELLVAAKIAVGGQDDAASIAAAIDGAEGRARAAVPELTLVIYLEPDLDRGASARPGWDADEPAAGEPAP